MANEIVVLTQTQREHIDILMEVFKDYIYWINHTYEDVTCKKGNICKYCETPVIFLNDMCEKLKRHIIGYEQVDIDMMFKQMNDMFNEVGKNINK